MKVQYFDIMLLSDEEHFTIILSAIRDYIPGENDIAILIVEKVSNQIITSVDKQFSTQDIYDEVVECFDTYNDFVKEKNVDLKLIEDGFYELVLQYLNIIVEEYNEKDIKET